MNKDEIVDFMLTLPEAELDYPFGADVMVFKVLGKMFALIIVNDGVVDINLKGAPADNEALTSMFTAIKPGYHMNKKHWITVSVTEEIEDGMLKGLIDRSFELVVAKLKKADRERLAIQR
ncbi:MmcQ/YjbR family DNA-binding protein [Photobacterium rosenbergii]|uniref:MmcQ/YjbR family DNA-binding protein n=1 Tax=Photobacterium rosenbergii TaxID=294936 RepID=UPI001C99800C|nr:MmcQ/YjbR family DNA-binding protein [Photobacterium rosenbergii]MBY5946124.1 MmcQ/YjbR family DNA-binding protein [Photobacterium rosenbergii]